MFWQARRTADSSTDTAGKGHRISEDLVESSISEAYCEALINDSVVDSFSNASKTSSPKGKKSCSDPKKSDDMQQIINTKIRQYLNRMLLAKECQKSEEQTQGCLTPGHTGPQSPSPSDSRFEYFAYRFICASSGSTAS